MKEYNRMWNKRINKVSILGLNSLRGPDRILDID